MELPPKIMYIIKFYRRSKLEKIFLSCSEVVFFLDRLWECSLLLFNPITYSVCVIPTVKHDRLPAEWRCCLGEEALQSTCRSQIFAVSCIWRAGHSLTVRPVIHGQSWSHPWGNINWVGSPKQVWESGISLTGTDSMGVRKGSSCLVGVKFPPATGS